MPPVKRRDLTVFLLDLDMRPELLERSKGVLMEICSRKLFCDTADLLQLILVNSGEKSSQGPGYERLTVCLERPLTCDPVKFYELIMNIKSVDNTSSAAQANWLNAIKVALEQIDLINVSKGILTYQIVFMTDLLNVSSGPRQQQQRLKLDIIDKINHDAKIYFYLMGPQVKLANMLRSYADLEEFRRKTDIFPEGCSENFDILFEIIRGTSRSIVCDLNLGKELVFCYKKPKGLQPWYVPLTIGNDDGQDSIAKRLPTSMSRMVRHVMLTLTASYMHVNVQWKWVYEDDNQSECDYANVIGCVMLQDKFLPMTPELVASFKQRTFRSFKVIGFTASENVPEYLFSGDGTQVVRQDHRQDQKTYRVIQALAETLYEKKMYIIASRVYANNTKIKLMCLIPKIDMKPISFLAVELPYADDVKEFVKSHRRNKARNGEQFEEVAQADAEQLECTYEYLDSICDDALLKNNVLAHVLSPLFSLHTSANILYRQSLEKLLGASNIPFAYDEDANMVTADLQTVAKYSRLENIWNSLAEYDSNGTINSGLNPEGVDDKVCLSEETAEFCF